MTKMTNRSLNVYSNSVAHERKSSVPATASADGQIYSRSAEHTRNSRHLSWSRILAMLILTVITAVSISTPLYAASNSGQSGAAAASKTSSRTVNASMRLYQIAAIEYNSRTLRFVSSNQYWEKGTDSNWDTKIQFKSSNKNVATVSRYGEITAKKKGKTVITATLSGRKLTVKLTVTGNKKKPVSLKKLQCYQKYRRYMSYSQFNQAYKKAVKMTRPFLDLSTKAKLVGVSSILSSYAYNVYFGNYSMSRKHYNDPYGILVKNMGSCAGITRTTGMCLNILGIRFEHVNENKYKHQWARVKVGKTYWICDPGFYVGQEPGKRRHPLV